MNEDKVPKLECRVEDIFKITGRGYILTLILSEPNIPLRIGDVLRYQSDEERVIVIKAIEMINFRNKIEDIRKDNIGILVDLSDEQAHEAKGKILIKH